MGRIRIAQIITRMDWGGSPDIVRILCENLLPQEFELTLVMGMTRNPSERTKRFLDSFAGASVTIPELVREVSPRNDYVAWRKLRQLFSSARFDLIHTHTTKAGALGRHAALSAGCKQLVHTPHGHVFYGYFHPLFTVPLAALERTLCRRTRALVAVTQLEKEDYLRLRIAPAERIRVIRHGLLFAETPPQAHLRRRVRAELGVPEEALLVSMISRLEPVKGPQYFIEAARLLAGSLPEAYFLVAGEGSLRRRLQERLRRQSWGKRVIFTGWRQDTAALLSASDILVLPSLNEAAGLILIEAQAQAVPVIASAVGGVPEMIKDAQTGFLVPPAQPQRIAEKVRVLAADPAGRRAMAGRAREWARSVFCAEEMVAKHRMLYHELCR